MTKRTYTIIIALLVALDIATGFWYIAGHINSDGKSDIFDSDHGLAVAADTISDKSIDDKFEMIENDAYFVSNSPAIAGNMQTFFASIKRIKCKLPTEINGNSDLGDLMAAIAEKAFPGSHSNLDGGIQMFLKAPTFNYKGIDYKVIDTAPTIVAKYGNVQGVKIYPIFTSRNYLVMAIDLTSYDGDKTREKLLFVNYNRTSQTVLKKGNIFAANTDDDILELVNKKIEKLNEEEHESFKEASYLSPELYLRRNGIFFVYQPGEISDDKDPIEVFVSFKTLQEYLTPTFRGIVSENADYNELKPITFKQG